MKHQRILKYTCWLCVCFILTLLPNMAYAQRPSGTYAAGITCLNLSLGDHATEATIDFYNADGEVTTSISSRDIQPNSPWLLFSPDIPGLPEDLLVSSVVRSADKLACSVNVQRNDGTIRVGTSQGQSKDEVGPKLFATQIVHALSGFNSYVAVQNVGDSATNMRAIYYDSAGENKFETIVSIPAKASKIFYQSEAGLDPNFIGSATFEGCNGKI